MNMNIPHVHLLLNHIPTIGGAAALVLLIIAFVRKSDDLKRIALEATYVVALFTFPAYLSGVGAQQVLLDIPDVSQLFVDAHWTAALWTFAFMQLAGALAWLALWKWRRIGVWPTSMVAFVFVFSALSFASAARAANLGGEIRHPEIIVNAQVAAETGAVAEAPDGAAPSETEVPPEAEAGWITGRGLGKTYMDRNWMWPASEALHFIGLWLILGVILLVNMRLLGFMRAAPYSAFHRLLPWAALGLAINVVTGMMFVTGTPEQYGLNVSFLWKIVFLMIAGLDLLYITVFEGPWNHAQAGQDPPMRVKIAGATAILSWALVMYFGRMLPFLGNAF